MGDRDVYSDLAEHLDSAIVGVPRTPTLIKILRILYPGEEADIAARLPFEAKTLEELVELLPDKGESLGYLLDRMAEGGTVFRSQRPGEEPRYRLLPSVVGFSETPFWAGKDTERARALAPLWVKYAYEAFGGELARGVPLVRVVPVNESLEDDSQVLPYDALEEKIAESSFIAVAHCPCRQMMRYQGEGCEHTLENCLHLGSMGRYIVEQGMGREITREETMKILEEADREGLVHICDNFQGRISTICNCCSCCCVFFRTKKYGLDSLSSSNYVARVDSESCTGCGNCEDRCPVQAVAVKDDGIASVNEELCIGCGICTPTCEGEAIALRQREEESPPPELVEFLTARMR